MTTPASGSTLFPYTTLFRSAPARAAHLCNCRSRALGGTSPASVKVPGARSTIDRKSTRLNSSHVEISYAVFCLKKKTEHEPRKLSLSVNKEGEVTAGDMQLA